MRIGYVRFKRFCGTIEPMSTTWTLACTNGDKETAIEVTDAISFGVAGAWKALTPSDWDVPGGAISNYGQPVLYLAASTSTPHELRDFKKTTSRSTNSTGSGTKNSLDGHFPEGDFEWICTRRR